MLFLHPCTMRKGAALINPVTVLQVRWSGKRVRGESEWVRDSYSAMPLPDLHATSSNTHIADFLAIGVAPSADLDRDRRIATLSQRGRGLLQQRVIHHLTRLVVPLGDLALHTRAVERELGLQADWCEAACERGGQMIGIVTAAEADFDAYMRADGKRAMLADDAQVHGVISAVQREITKRYR
jgi:hypothetical protein